MVLNEDFQKELGYYLKLILEKHKRGTIDRTHVAADWRPAKNAAAVTAWFKPDQIEFLNKHPDALSYARQALKKVYRYDGAVIFDEEDVPF